jgi:TRAP-type C4-dicarboxylate transport system permease small subunit
MSKKSFFSRFTKKQLYAFIMIGIAISLIFLALSYSVKVKIESGQLTPEESTRQTIIYFLTCIGTTIGFIIALIPSVKIFQRDFESLKTKNEDK